MRFFHTFAWASRGFFFALWMGVSAAQAAEVPAFTVDPSTVTAGRTLSILCQSKKKLSEARLRVGETETRFYKMRHKTWVARVGISATEPAGSHRALFTLSIGSDTLPTEIPFYVQEGSYPVSVIALAPEKDALFTNGSVERDGQRLASFYKKPGCPEKLWEGPFLWPSTGIVSSPFGARRSYGGRPPSGSHSGVDLANAEGTPVSAPARGRVALAERLESFGHVVLLDHGQGIYTYTLHMSSSVVKQGQWVKRGQRLGLMGKEGIATGPHVHWSLCVAGVRVDPMEWANRSVP